MKGSKSDSSRDKQKVFSKELIVYGEAVSVRTANGYLLPDLNGVKPLCQASALFDAELHIFGICRG